MLISEPYRALNVELHGRVPAYGTGGYRWAPVVDLLSCVLKAQTVLDYGCGKGTLREALGAHVREYDPAIPGKDGRPARADIVCCLDVLEHVEPDCLSAVLADLVSLSGKALLLDVSCKLGGKLLADGRPAHINVQPAAWWKEKLAPLGAVLWLESEQDTLACVIFVGVV